MPRLKSRRSSKRVLNPRRLAQDSRQRLRLLQVLGRLLALNAVSRFCDAGYRLSTNSPVSGITQERGVHGVSSVAEAVRLLNQGRYPPTVEGLQRTRDMLVAFLDANIAEVGFAVDRYRLTVEALARVQEQLGEFDEGSDDGGRQEGEEVDGEEEGRSGGDGESADEGNEVD